MIKTTNIYLRTLALIVFAVMSVGALGANITLENICLGSGLKSSRFYNYSDESKSEGSSKTFTAANGQSYTSERKQLSKNGSTSKNYVNFTAPYDGSFYVYALREGRNIVLYDYTSTKVVKEYTLTNTVTGYAFNIENGHVYYLYTTNTSGAVDLYLLATSQSPAPTASISDLRTISADFIWYPSDEGLSAGYIDKELFASDKIFVNGCEVLSLGDGYYQTVFGKTVKPILRSFLDDNKNWYVAIKVNPGAHVMCYGRNPSGETRNLRIATTNTDASSHSLALGSLGTVIGGYSTVYYNYTGSDNDYLLYIGGTSNVDIAAIKVTYTAPTITVSNTAGTSVRTAVGVPSVLPFSVTASNIAGNQLKISGAEAPVTTSVSSLPTAGGSFNATFTPTAAGSGTKTLTVTDGFVSQDITISYEVAVQIPFSDTSKELNNFSDDQGLYSNNRLLTGNEVMIYATPTLQNEVRSGSNGFIQKSAGSMIGGFPTVGYSIKAQQKGWLVVYCLGKADRDRYLAFRTDNQSLQGQDVKYNGTYQYVTFYYSSDNVGNVFFYADGGENIYSIKWTPDNNTYATATPTWFLGGNPLTVVDQKVENEADVRNCIVIATNNGQKYPAADIEWALDESSITNNCGAAMSTPGVVTATWPGSVTLKARAKTSATTWTDWATLPIVFHSTDIASVSINYTPHSIVNKTIQSNVDAKVATGTPAPMTVTLKSKTATVKVNNVNQTVTDGRFTYNVTVPAHGVTTPYYIDVMDAPACDSPVRYTVNVYHQPEPVTAITSNGTALTTNISGQYALSASSAGASLPVSVTLLSGMTAQLSEMLTTADATPTNYQNVTLSGNVATLNLISPAVGLTRYYKLQITRSAGSGAPARVAPTEFGDVYVFAVTTESEDTQTAQFVNNQGTALAFTLNDANIANYLTNNKVDLNKLVNLEFNLRDTYGWYPVVVQTRNGSNELIHQATLYNRTLEYVSGPASLSGNLLDITDTGNITLKLRTNAGSFNGDAEFSGTTREYPAYEFTITITANTTTQSPLTTLTSKKTWTLKKGEGETPSFPEGNVIATGVYDGNKLKLYADDTSSGTKYTHQFTFGSSSLSFNGDGAKAQYRCLEFVVDKSGTIELTGYAGGENDDRGFKVECSVGGTISGSAIVNGKLDYTNVSSKSPDKKSVFLEKTGSEPVHVYVYSVKNVSLTTLSWIPEVTCTSIEYSPDGQNVHWVFPGQRIDLEKAIKARYGTGNNDYVWVQPSDGFTIGNQTQVDVNIHQYQNKYLVPLQPTTDDITYTANGIPEQVEQDGVIYKLSNATGYDDSHTFTINRVNNADARNLTTFSDHKKFWFGSNNTNTSSTGCTDYYISSVSDAFAEDRYGDGTNKYLDVQWYYGQTTTGTTDRMSSRGEFYKLATQGPGTLKVKIGLVASEENSTWNNATSVFSIVPETADNQTEVTIGDHKEYTFNYYGSDTDERIITLINRDYYPHNIYFIEWIPLAVDHVDFGTPGDITLSVGDQFTNPTWPMVYFTDGTSAEVTANEKMTGGLNITPNDNSVVKALTTPGCFEAMGTGTATLYNYLGAGAEATHAGTDKTFTLPYAESETYIVTVVEEGTGHRIWKFGIGGTGYTKTIEDDKSVYTIYDLNKTSPYSQADGSLKLNGFNKNDGAIVATPNGETAFYHRYGSDGGAYSYTIHVKTPGTFRFTVAGVDNQKNYIPGNVPRNYSHSPLADGETEPLPNVSVGGKQTFSYHYSAELVGDGIDISLVQPKGYGLIYSIEWIPDGKPYIHSTTVDATAAFKSGGIARVYDVAGTQKSQTQSAQLTYLYGDGNIITANGVLKAADGTESNFTIPVGDLTWYSTDPRVTVNSDGMNLTVNHAVADYTDFQTTLYVDLIRTDFYNIKDNTHSANGQKFVFPTDRTILAVPFKVQYQQGVTGTLLDNELEKIFHGDASNYTIKRTKVVALPTEVTVKMTNGITATLTNPTYTITSGSDYISIADGKLTATANGEATVNMTGTVTINNVNYPVMQSFTITVTEPETATLINNAPALISMAVGDKYTIPFPTLELPDGSKFTLDFTNTSFKRSHTSNNFIKEVTADGVVEAANDGTPHVDITYAAALVIAPDGDPYKYAESTSTMNVRVVTPTATDLQPITQNCQFRVGVTSYDEGLIENGYVWNTGIGTPDQNRSATITSLPNPMAGAQIDDSKAVGFKIEPPEGYKAFIRVYANADNGAKVQLLQGGNFGDAKTYNTDADLASSSKDKSVITLKYNIIDASTYWIYNSSGKNTYLLGFDIGFYQDNKFEHKTNTYDNPIVLDPASPMLNISAINDATNGNFTQTGYDAQVKTQDVWYNIVNKSLSYADFNNATKDFFTVSSGGGLTLKKSFAGETKAVTVNLEGGNFTYGKSNIFYPSMVNAIYVKMKEGAKVMAFGNFNGKTIHASGTGNNAPVSEGDYYVVDITALSGYKVYDTTTGTTLSCGTEGVYTLGATWSVGTYNCTTAELKTLEAEGNITFDGTTLKIKKTAVAEAALNVKLTATPTEGNNYFPISKTIQVKLMPYFEFNEKNVRFNVTSFAKEIVRKGDSYTDINSATYKYTCSDESTYIRYTSATEKEAGTLSDPYTHYYYIPTGYDANVAVYVPYYSSDTYDIKYKTIDDNDWKSYDIASAITGKAKDDNGRWEQIIDVKVEKKDGTDEVKYYRLKFDYLNAPKITVKHFSGASATGSEVKKTMSNTMIYDAKSATVKFEKSSSYKGAASASDNYKLYYTKDTSLPAWDNITGGAKNTVLFNESTYTTLASSPYSYTLTTQKNNVYYIAQFPEVDNFYTGNWELYDDGATKMYKKTGTHMPLISNQGMVAMVEEGVEYAKKGQSRAVGDISTLKETHSGVEHNTMYATWGKSGVWYRNSTGRDYIQGIFQFDNGKNESMSAYADAYQYSNTISGDYGNPYGEVFYNVGNDGSEAGGRFQNLVTGAIVRVEPEYDGVVTIWMRVNGAAMSNTVESGGNKGLLGRRPVYIMDENGTIMPRTTIRGTSDNYFCLNGTSCLLPGHSEFRHYFERSWQYATEHPYYMSQQSNSSYLETLYLYAHNYDWLNLNFSRSDFSADPVSRYSLFDGAIYGSDKLARTKINWQLSTDGTTYIKPKDLTGDRYFLDGFARYGYELPNFYYARFRFPVKAGKTYFIGGRNTKNGINAVKFEPLRANYQTWIYRDKDSNPALNDDGTVKPYDASTNNYSHNSSLASTELGAGTGGRDKDEAYWSYGESATGDYSSLTSVSKIKTFTMSETAVNGLSDATDGAASNPSTLASVYTKGDVSSYFHAYAQGGYTCNVKLQRRFTAGYWHPIVLPFSVSESRMRQIFGDDVAVIYLDPDQNAENPHAMQTVDRPAIDSEHSNVLNFTYHYYQMLYANMPAFICPTFTWHDSEANANKGNVDASNDGKRQTDTNGRYYKENITFERVTYVGNRETRYYKPSRSYTKGTDVDGDENGVYVDLAGDDAVTSINTYGYDSNYDSKIGYPIGGGYRVVGSYKVNDYGTQSADHEMYYLDNVLSSDGQTLTPTIKHTTKGVNMKATRVWIEKDTEHYSGAPARPLTMIGVRGFNPDDDVNYDLGFSESTDIQEVLADKDTQRMCQHDPNVYNLQGVSMGKVSQNVTLESIRRRLPAGIYIFQGKKIMKR